MSKNSKSRWSIPTWFLFHGIAEKIDEAISEHYSLQGLPVPDWKRPKVEWWREYLISLGLDPNNP